MSHRFFGPPEMPGCGGTFNHPAHFALKVLTFSFLLLFLTAVVADSRELTVRKNARGYQVEATIDRYPLVLGDNHVDIGIKDGSGKSITDAEVLVNYYMPPMPRMV